MSFSLQAHEVCKFEYHMLQREAAQCSRKSIGLPRTSFVNLDNYLTPLSSIFLCIMKLTIAAIRVVMKIEYECNIKG